MTLILMATTQIHTIVVSDRRLTANGKIVDSSANKAIDLELRDARVILTFTGLARVGDFDTREFLIECIRGLVPVHATLRAFVKALRDALTARFALPPLVALIPRDKALLVCVAGALEGEENGRLFSDPVYGTISNTAPNGSFKMAFGIPEGPTLEIAGYGPALTEGDKVEVLRFINQNVPPSIVAKKMCDRVRQASKTARSSGLVGSELSWIYLDRQTFDSTAGFYPEHAYEHAFPDRILMDRATAEIAIVTGVTVTGPVPDFFLPSFERNQACPCGSTVQFRHCHGRNSSRPAALRPPETPR
jgi:hypothetical protein